MSPRTSFQPSLLALPRRVVPRSLVVAAASAEPSRKKGTVSLQPRGKAVSHDGTIETHPEIGPGRAFELIKMELVQDEQRKLKRSFLTLLRVADTHVFTIRWNDFRLGRRLPDRLLYQLPAIVSGEFLLANLADGQLGQGSRKDIELIRAHDGHRFSQRCYVFCRGQRSPDKLL